MLTGARRNEALSATWSHFDLENGTWRKPSAHTKQRREHMVPLSAPVLHLLAGIKEASTSKYVFPQPGDTDEPLRNINNAWMRIRKAAKIEDVRLHDLRHSYASILESAGVSLPIIGQLLGHTQVETTQRYGHLQDDALREATKRVGEVIESTVQDAAEIILLRPRQ